MAATDSDIANLQAENARLRQRIQELERGAESADSGDLLAQLISKLPIKADIWRLDRPDDITSMRLVLTSNVILSDPRDMRLCIGQTIREVFPSVTDAILEHYAEVLRTNTPRALMEIRVQLSDGSEGVANLHAIPLSDRHLCVLVEDLTARSRAEEAQRQVMEQQAVIRAQQMALAELSTPLIPITDQVMVMPLIGAIDSRRAQLVMENLLRGISEQRASVVILDITGVPIVDTQVANALIQAAQAVKLLGAHVVLTGIRPEVAQTLVGLGINLSEIITMSNVQGGIAYATAGRRA